ncbi:Uncharacterised protein [Vibrio cholerae]|nr:Uncharacterised protein [Vibrio cholerae]
MKHCVAIVMMKQAKYRPYLTFGITVCTKGDLLLLQRNHIAGDLALQIRFFIGTDQRDGSPSSEMREHQFRERIVRRKIEY